MRGTRYGDFSRFSFDPGKGYTGVLVQQGRVQLDADWNDQRAIAEHAFRVALGDLLPGSWAPASRPGFAVRARVARRFEGADRLLLDESGSLGPGGEGQHTLELWLTWSGGAAVLVDCRGRKAPPSGAADHPTEAPPSGAADHPTNGGLGYELAIEETGTVVLVLSVRQGAGSALRLYSATPVHVGKPAHLAVVVGDDFAALVVDGKQVAHGRHSGLAELDTSVLVLGGPAADTSWNVGFRGYVTAIRVWAVARTIADLAAATHAAPTSEWATTDPGLLALWSFDQPGDLALNDAAGGRTATINDGGSTNWHLVDLVIEAGRLYVDGVACELAESITYTSQPGSGGTLPTSGEYLAYLEIWEESVSAAEDASLREVALGGLDPSIRTRMATRVRLQEIDEDDTNGLTPSRTARLGRLAAQHTGHRVPGNHLYRIEIHGDGELTGATQATFKWSRDNGASVFAVTAGPQDDVLQLLYTAAGATPLAPDDVVEALPDGAPLDGPAHPLLRVTAVSAADGTITLDGAPPPGTSLLRRWDNHSRADRAPGTGAELPVAGDWIELEDGIRIRFEAGEFRRGDYWWIVSRMDSGDIDWPTTSGHPKALEPGGVERLTAPLARLSLQNGWIEIEDLRRIVKPIPSPGSAPAVWGSAAAPSAPAAGRGAPADETSGKQTEEEYIGAFFEESSNGEGYEEPYIEVDPETLADIEGDEAAAAEGGTGQMPSVADFPGSSPAAGTGWEAFEAADSEAAPSGPMSSWPPEPARPEPAAGAGWSHIGGLELGGGVLHSVASVADSVMLLTDKGLFALSVAEGEATKLASLPGKRHGSQLLAIGRLLLLAGGGSDEDDPDGSVFGFELDVGEWLPRAPIPVHHAHAALAVAHGHVHVLGGHSRGIPPHVHGTHHVYEPSTDRWREALELPTPRAGAAAATLGDRVHVVGGHGAHPLGEAHEAHVAHESFDLEKGSWRAEPPLPEARPVLASTAHNGRHVVVVGGERPRHGGHAAADVHEYDPVARTWKWRPGVPARLRDPIVVSHNGRLVAFGTRADGGVEIHELT
jgi:Family of unknown function (DUF6519)/Concanavalin A-like lectin/glucanases superfamily